MPADTVTPMPANERRSTLYLHAFLHTRFFVPCALLLFTLLMLGRTLVSSAQNIPTAKETDAPSLFAPNLEFGFQQMRHGHIPLWNPHLFSGIPFLGDWQTGLLYPLNALYLVLPLAKAINVEIILHTFLAGWGTALWAQRYRVHPLAALLAGTMVAFGAPYYDHIYAGHLSLLDAAAWTPWLLLAVDALLDQPNVKWVLLGIGTLALEILAGHPQSVFNSLVAAALYSALRLPTIKKRIPALLCLAAIGLGGILISAAQIVSGLQAASEGTRHGGVPYAFAAMFSFAPENFATLLVPDAFGDITTVPYWGRCYLWEMCLFLGVTGLTLAVYGAFAAERKRRLTWAIMVVLLLWLALAAHTPLFPLLYRHVPGFNLFRAYAKFIFEASLFMAMLAALGCDRLIRTAYGARLLAIITGVTALLLGGFGLWLSSETNAGRTEFLAGLIANISATGESYLPSDLSHDLHFLSAAQSLAAAQFLIAGGVLFVLTILLFAVRASPKWAFAIASLGILELLFFAAGHTATVDVRSARMSAGEQRFLSAHPGDYRILQMNGRPNDVMGSAVGDIWGYDPLVMSRYAQFITLSQGGRPEDANDYIDFHQFPTLYRMLRCRFVFLPLPNNRVGVHEVPKPLPHVLLVPNWKAVPGRQAALNALFAPGFDPSTTAILETSDVPVPSAGSGLGSVQLLAQTSDSLTIRADVPQPSLLLITDTYSRFFRADALPGSSQFTYRVLPADYTLMAIPLGAGHHLLRLHYLPDGFVAACWVSVVSSIAYLTVLTIFLVRHRRRRVRP